MKVKRKVIWICGIVSIVIFILVMGKPYYHVNLLTEKYGDEFKDRYMDIGFYDNVEYFKVIKYEKESAGIYFSDKTISHLMESLNDEYAAVIYVEQGHSSVSLFVFKNEDKNMWKLSSWHTVWSASGSADSMTWPLYR